MMIDQVVMFAFCVAGSRTVAFSWPSTTASVKSLTGPAFRSRKFASLGPTQRRKYWRSSSVVFSAIQGQDEEAKTTHIPSSSGGSETDRQPWNNLYGEQIESLLVVGDGDLSHSAALAPSLADVGVKLTATVLEDQETHHATYQQSRQHTETILSHDHSVMFGINATDMISHFPPDTAFFDRIQFNFPHWRGKANHRYNRRLIDDFLRSASDYLSERGEIHIALCEGQGGGTATTNQEWRESWKAAEYAATHGLLLRSVTPYQPIYDLSSHRGMDRAFRIGKVPKLYVFNKPDSEASVKTDRVFQMCCRHELHVNLPEEGPRPGSPFTIDDIVEGSAIQTIAEGVVDRGICVDVPMRRILKPEEANSDFPVAVFLMSYCGEGTTLTRDQADGYRAALEAEIQEKHLPLRTNRAGRLVSRPFPHPLLDNLIYHYLQPKEQKDIS